MTSPPTTSPSELDPASIRQGIGFLTDILQMCETMLTELEQERKRSARRKRERDALRSAFQGVADIVIPNLNEATSDRPAVREG